MEILELSNNELKASKYSIKRFTVDYRKDLYDNRKYFGKRKTCMIGNYLHYGLQRERILISFCKDSFNLD